MDKSQFKKLVDRYLAGKASPEEEKQLLWYYDAFQEKGREWDEVSMGDKEASRIRVYKKIIGTIGKKEKRRGRMSLNWAAAASIAVFLTLSALLYFNQVSVLNYIDPVRLVEKRIPRGKMMKLILQDGTKVWLNAESRLVFPDKFRGNTREVSLSGEAYFEVAHNKNKPFIIHSGQVTTKVLGTSFNIRAIEDEKNVEVAVVTGKVSVEASNASHDREAVLLLPNQQAVYSKTKHSLSSESVADAVLKTAWKDGRLHFRNTPLPLVIQELERKYDVRIAIDEGLLSCLVYADFENQPIDKVLKLLAESLRGSAGRGQNSYTLTGRSCSQ